MRVVDFGELLLRSYELLRDNDPIRQHYQLRFRHVLIDEFQDTNRLQYAWLKLLCGPQGSLFAVGDDDQSIYAFRGARVGNMADFLREYSVQHQIKLEQNYRSCGAILDTANELISHNTSRLGKNLRTDQGTGELVRVVESPSDFAEAQWLVEEVRQLLRDGQNGDGSNGVALRSDVAVLYRSNAQSRVIETSLFNAGLPYRVYGGLRFFERAEIKHALAYLRLLENPSDDTSFLRVVNFPARGIGARSIEQLQDAAHAVGSPLHDAVPSVTGKAGTLLSGFVSLVQEMRQASEGMNLREIVQLVIERSGLIEHYRTEREGADRIENLEELVNAAESFVAQEGFGRDAPGVEVNDGLDGETGETLSPLVAFLTHAALEAGDNQAQAGQDAIQLMTVHAAKGLEFDAVFITGLEEGLFPHENSLSSREGLEEERRLMYVALTRARKRLFLSHAQTRMLHGQTRYNIPSRFYDEMPEQTLKWVSQRQAPARWDASGWDRASKASPPAWGNAPVVAKAASEGPHAWLRSGVQVFHNKFGEGTVLALEGAGDDARAQISFPRHGTKWLALSVAKLTQV